MSSKIVGHVQVSQEGDVAPALAFNNDSSANLRITLTPDKTLYRPWEPVSFTVVTDRDCYLTLMYLSPSGKVLVIWPYNQSSPLEHRVRANEEVRVPHNKTEFKLVPDGSATRERLVAVACTARDTLLQEQDFRTSSAMPVKSFNGTVEDLAMRLLERSKRVPVHVRWGTAELTIRVNSSRTEPSMSSIYPESESEQLEYIDQQTVEQDPIRKQEKTMWIGGYYVGNHRPCDLPNLTFPRALVEGYLKNKPKWLNTNFLYGNENVHASDFHKKSCYYRSPSRPNGFDGLDSVHIAVTCTHGGPGQQCMGGKGYGGCDAFSRNMSLGQKNLRYFLVGGCDTVPLPNPSAVWFAAAKGVRAIFGHSGTTFDSPKGRDTGKIFWQNWNRSRNHSITYAWLDKSWRRNHKLVPVALWFGPDKKTVREMCEKEAQFHFEPVQPNYAYWQYYSSKPIRRRKDVDLISGAAVVFKPVEEKSDLPSLLEKSGLVEKGSLQLIDKESNEDTTTYYSHDHGPTLLVNRSSGAFDLQLPEFEAKGSVEYGDDEAISIASAYCKKIETRLKSLPLESETVSTELEPCEIRYTVQGASSGPAEKANEQITQRCVVFRPVVNGLPTIGTGGVLEVTLNAAKQVCRVRSVLREVASVTREKSIFDPQSLEPLAKQRALDAVRQMTSDEDCRVKDVELGYFAADEDEIQKVSRPAFQVTVESGSEPCTVLFEKVYDLEDLSRDKNE